MRAQRVQEHCSLSSGADCRWPRYGPPPPACIAGESKSTHPNEQAPRHRVCFSTKGSAASPRFALDEAALTAGGTTMVPLAPLRTDYAADYLAAYVIDPTAIALRRIAVPR